MNNLSYHDKLLNSDISFNDIPKKHITKELCEIAVFKHCCVLKYVPKEYINMELCYIAVFSNNSIKYHPKYLEYIPDEYKTIEFYNLIVSNKEKYLNMFQKI